MLAGPRRGKMVILLGPDGCGKSTVADRLWDRLSMGHSVSRLHMRPRLLPPLAKLRDPQQWFEPSVESDATNPHGHPPSGRVMSLIRLGYYLTDYLLGYRIRVAPRLGREDDIVLFERYYYDLIVDPARLRLSIPAWLARALLPMIPKPDHVILLDAAPSVLHARKMELTLDELERQVPAYRTLVAGLPMGRSISVDQPIETVVDEVLAVIS